MRWALRLSLCALFGLAAVSLAAAEPIIKNVVIKADRDIGYFVGDLVSATVEVSVPQGWELRKSSLPHEGPIDYWLDLRKLNIQENTAGDDRLITIKLLYQNFYDALDVRNQEIPSFPLYFSKGDEVAQADVPSWTISVSALREIAPPPLDDPKDYLHPDTPTGFIRTNAIVQAATVFAVMSAVPFLLVCYRLAWWPFTKRAARPLAAASRQIHHIRGSGSKPETYLQALLIQHRGFDAVAGRRLLAEDLPRFIQDHPQFLGAREALSKFFEISREAFFKSDPQAAQRDMPFASLESFSSKMAQIERQA